MDNKITAVNEAQVTGVDVFDESDLPVILHGQIAKLDELDQQVKKATAAAENAKTSADKAKSLSVGWFNKKAVIEELQSACIDVAEAVQSGGKAQKVSFEFQAKLAEVAKYLLRLGVSNIAANRTVVRELELRLRGASKEKLSELARRELFLVVKQLKDQQDILIKQEGAEEAIKAHDAQLKKHAKIVNEQAEQLERVRDEIENAQKGVSQDIHILDEKMEDALRLWIEEFTTRIGNSREAIQRDINNQQADLESKIESASGESIKRENAIEERLAGKLDKLEKETAQLQGGIAQQAKEISGMREFFERADQQMAKTTSGLEKLNADVSTIIAVTNKQVAENAERASDLIFQVEQSANRNFVKLQRNFYISIGFAIASLIVAGWAVFAHT